MLVDNKSLHLFPKLFTVPSASSKWQGSTRLCAREVGKHWCNRIRSRGGGLVVKNLAPTSAYTEQTSAGSWVNTWGGHYNAIRTIHGGRLGRWLRWGGRGVSVPNVNSVSVWELSLPQESFFSSDRKVTESSWELFSLSLLSHAVWQITNSQQ